MSLSLRSPGRAQAVVQPKRKITYVYLVSAPHSGSTLMACVLGRHRDISTVGELGANISEQGTCSCGSSYEQCEFWQEVARTAAEEGLNFQPWKAKLNLDAEQHPSRLSDLYFHLFPFKLLDSLRNLCYPPGSSFRRESAAAIEQAVQVAELICRLEGTRVFFDSMKNPSQIPFLARCAEIDFKVVTLVRDGRAVVASLMRKEKWDFQRSIDCWMYGNRTIMRANKYVPPQARFFLKHREFCNSAAIRNELYEFMGVEPLQENAPPAKSPHIIGNSMRLNFQGIKQVDDTWREFLTPAQLDQFERQAGWLNRRLGYE